MIISFLGGQTFKISQGDLTLATNPPSKESGLKSTKFGADITLVSLDHEDFNGIENTTFGDREPFLIKGPGEYEVRGVVVHGFASESNYGGETGINTIYTIDLEGMRLCFLGVLAKSELPQAATEELDNIDVLFVPVSKEGTLDESQGYRLAVSLEPKVVIPMGYDSVSLQSFLKEAGAEGTKPIEKLTVRKKDLSDKEAEIVVLAS
jgi:hypothetical protein